VAENLSGRPVLDGLRVQKVVFSTGQMAFTIVEPDGHVHEAADRYLKTFTVGTARTYAYMLVDHLRWLRREGLTIETVSAAHLSRYMAALGAKFRGPYGTPWRAGKKPYSQSALVTAASCLKGFYVHLGSRGTRRDLATELNQTRLPTKLDRRRKFLGHTVTGVSGNPLSPSRNVRRHPKLPPQHARETLVAAALTARDRMAITWLADGGFRVGELCGLHLVDLHLRANAVCGQCKSRHVHICHRELNPNGSRVKTKVDWTLSDGVVIGGAIRRVSPAMVHSYFEYMTTEYPPDADHGMLFVQLQGSQSGGPWAASALRGMLARTSHRAGIGLVKPHAFRHQFATDVLSAAGGNALIARDAGGWASASTVEEIYGHVDVDDPVFSGALERVWRENER